jgi:hypothetical protein
MDNEHNKLFYMGAAHDRLPWRAAIMRREYLKEASRCMIQQQGAALVNDSKAGHEITLKPPIYVVTGD